MSGFTFAFLIFVLFVTCQVVRIVKCNSKWVLVMLLCLNLELIGMICMMLFNAYDPVDGPNTFWSLLQLYSVLFLTMTFIINLRNWAFYNIKIGEMAYQQQIYKESTFIDENIVQMKNNAPRNIKILDLFTGLLLAL